MISRTLVSDSCEPLQVLRSTTLRRDMCDVRIHVEFTPWVGAGSSGNRAGECVVCNALGTWQQLQVIAVFATCLKTDPRGTWLSEQLHESIRTIN